MATRKGICSNIDNCSKAEKQEEQILDKKEQFVCQECGLPLIPILDGKEMAISRKTIAILLAILIVGGGCAAVYFFRDTLFTRKPEVVTEKVLAVEQETEQGKEEMALPEATRQEERQPEISVQEPVQVQAEEPILEANIEDEEPMAENDICVLNEEDYTPQEINIGYAIWNGKILYNLPHDTKGKMTFTCRHIIESRDEKKREAEKGDYIIGEYNEGHLVQGRWYDAKGKYKGSLLIGLPQK